MYDEKASHGESYMKVLALSSNYEPLGVIPWFRAVSLIFTDKVTTLEEYDHEIRSPSISIKAPSVVLFKKSSHGKKFKNVIRFSRKNVWVRDEGKCQYCSKSVTLSNFTIDHVVPKTSGGVTTWENVVTCCYSCNQFKGNKSLNETGYKLQRLPKRPVRLSFSNALSNEHYDPEKNIPHSWKFYLER